MAEILPPKVAADPTVQRIARALTTVRSQNRDLREQAAYAQSPMTQTMATQGGAVAAAAVAVYVPPERRPLAQGALSLLGLAYGLVQGSPAAISFANGAAAPLTYAKAVELFSAQKKPTTGKNKKKATDEDAEE